MEIKINGNKIFAPLKNKELVLKPEEKVRQEYICRLVNDYGFSLDQMDQEVQVSNSQRGQGMARADIVVWKSAKDKADGNTAAIVIECKAEHITIREDDYFQGYNYASWAGADFFVTTNLKETRIFRVNKGKIPKKLEEIVDIPKASDITNAKKLKEILTQTKKFTRDEFSTLLFKCHNIIRNNDKLSPEAAFDEISKILFMKIRYERNPDEANVFTLKQFQKQERDYEKNIRLVNVKRNGPKDDIPYMHYWFELTKAEFKNDDLFDDDDKIRIRQNSFEAIVEELEIYNLSQTADDVKGIAFEKFLGKTFRGELGQFFTPRTVVNFIVELLDPEEGEVICDPCCGSGGFLIRAFEYVREKIEKDIQKQKEKIKGEKFDVVYDKMTEKKKAEVDEIVNTLFNTLNNELDTQHEESRLKFLSHDCIYGTDANPRMARTAKMNMIMHGDGHGGVHHHDGLLNVNGIFEERFDVILTNPPFGARVEKSLKITESDAETNAEKIAMYEERYGEDVYGNALAQITGNIGESVLDLYKSGKLSALTEVLFIERCLNLLKPGGRLGIVLPEGVLNTSSLQSVRELFESMAKIVLITSIPQDVFMASGATVKPSILFMKKFTEEERKQYDGIVADTINELELKYKAQIDELEKFIDNPKNKSSEIKPKRLMLKMLKLRIVAESKPIVKERFDYQIPIAQIEKAGITTTGAECDNELNALLKEYTPYRKKQGLWNSFKQEYTYRVENDKLQRKLNDKDWEELC